MSIHRILYLEGELEFQKLLKNRLTEAGFEVYVCGTLSEGLKVCVRFEPSLIILSSNMPNGDAYDFLQKLHKKKAEYKALPVLIISNFPEEEGVDLAVEYAGCDYLVRSDVSLESILSKVQKLLGV